MKQGTATKLDRWRIRPHEIMTDAGMTPDPWQRQLLHSRSLELALLASRQHGKSTVTGALGIKTVLLEAPAMILILSPTERQSIELLQDKFMRIWRAIEPPVPIKRAMQTSIEFANGSRIVALPSNEGGIRGYSAVSLLIIDEAAQVPDELVGAVRPMLATVNGRFIALTTPYGKRGWFYEQWDRDEKARMAGLPEEAERIRATAELCPRISKEFLAKERKRLGVRWWRQEYFCSFEDTIDAVFSQEDIQAAMRPEVRPIWEDEEDDG